MNYKIQQSNLFLGPCYTYLLQNELQLELSMQRQTQKQLELLKILTLLQSHSLQELQLQILSYAK